MIRLQLIAAVLLAAVGCNANFMVGDFVNTARKAQFGGQRGQWHDVLGAHCPKFGVSHMVAMPLPAPTNFKPGSDYKIQLSFDGDRVITPWLELIGRRTPEAPILIVELTRSGDALVSATATVENLPQYDIHYARVRKEFSDENAWPKHLPVHYKWKARHEVDSERGLLVLFIGGGIAMILAAMSVATTYNKQLRQFMENVAGETRYGGATFEKAD